MIEYVPMKEKLICLRDCNAACCHDVRFLYVVWPIALAQPVLYAVILRKQTFKNVYRTIMALSGLLTVGNALMLTYYVGLWSI